MFFKPDISWPTILSGLLFAAAWTGESDFRYDPEKVETGVVYQYVKSNIDGSNSGRISLYVAAKDKLESLKWHPQGASATLVVAEMDWRRFTVRRFESSELQRRRPTRRRAILESLPSSRVITARVGTAELEARVDHWPWHSYDFDLASLNFAWRHLIDPEKTFTIGITDAVREGEQVSIADKGEVTIVYRQDAQRGGHTCREYSIDGTGLENQGGTIWVRKSDGVFVDFEIALPDEEGFSSGKLRLIGIERMTAEQWEAYKQQCVSGE